MDEISARVARETWSNVLDHVEWRDQQYLITRHGKAIAVLRPATAEDAAIAGKGQSRSQPPESGHGSK